MMSKLVWSEINSLSRMVFSFSSKFAQQSFLAISRVFTQLETNVGYTFISFNLFKCGEKKMSGRACLARLFDYPCTHSTPKRAINLSTPCSDELLSFLIMFATQNFSFLVLKSSPNFIVKNFKLKISAQTSKA